MNIALHRIWAVMLRNMLSEKRNLIRLTDAIYWPTMDIILWGLTSTWMRNNQLQIPNIVLVIMSGLVMWQVVMRANYEISISMMEEMWHKSLINLFASPLTVTEWVIGCMLNGLIKTIFVLFFGAGVVWLLYALNIFTMGWMIIPFVFSLIMFGWTTGFLGSSLIIYYGQKASNLPWVMAFLFTPVSGVYYPIATLPGWAQKIAYALPTAYIFEGMRSIIFTGQMPYRELFISFCLNVTYLIGSISLFIFMFERSRNRGLDRL